MKDSKTSSRSLSLSRPCNASTWFEIIMYLSIPKIFANTHNASLFSIFIFNLDRNPSSSVSSLKRSKR